MSDSQVPRFGFTCRCNWVNLMFESSLARPMLISLLLIVIATAGGFPVTYVVDDDAPFMWRLAAGNIIGCAILGTVAFLFALGFGLGVGTVAAASLVTLLTVLVFRRPVMHRKLHDDSW